MIDDQGSLFGEGKITPPARSSAPDLEGIRQRLNALLGTLRASETMPLSERDIRVWQAIVPNMTKWLPEAEANAIRESFDGELQRLSRNTRN